SQNVEDFRITGWQLGYRWRNVEGLQFGLSKVLQGNSKMPSGQGVGPKAAVADSNVQEEPESPCLVSFLLSRRESEPPLIRLWMGKGDVDLGAVTPVVTPDVDTVHYAQHERSKVKERLYLV